MAYQNGIYEIGALGTLADFFTALKTKILEHTDWELLESAEISLTFDTKIHDITAKITDLKITDASSTTSNSLKLEFFKNDISVASLSNLTYTSAVTTQDTITTRTIFLLVHITDNATLINFINYSGSNWGWNNVFGFTTSKNIGDGTTTQRYIIGNNFYSAETGNGLAIKKIFADKANSGVSMINLHLVNSSTYTDYVPGLYNCTTLSAGKNYTINSKNYFAIDSNILIAE